MQADQTKEVFCLLFCGFCSFVFCFVGFVLLSFVLLVWVFCGCSLLRGVDGLGLQVIHANTLADLPRRLDLEDLVAVLLKVVGLAVDLDLAEVQLLKLLLRVDRP